MKIGPLIHCQRLTDWMVNNDSTNIRTTHEKGGTVLICVKTSHELLNELSFIIILLFNLITLDILHNYKHEGFGSDAAPAVAIQYKLFSYCFCHIFKSQNDRNRKIASEG